MLFEKEKYYKYIGALEKSIVMSYIVIILICTLIAGLISKGNGLIICIGIIVGIIIAMERTLKTKIQIQKMKWEIDIHTQTMKKEQVL